MRTAIVLLALSIGLPFILALFAARHAGPSKMDRALGVLCAPLIGFIFWLTCAAATIGATSVWSAAKLAPIVAMVRGTPHGYPLYEDPSSGVLSGWVYGPVPAILFLPAAICSTPTPELMIAMALNVLCILVPTIWIICQALRRAGSRQWTLGLMLICLFIVCAMKSLSLYLVTFVTGADAPAIGLAACSCAALMGGHGWRRLFFAALFAALAVWSKQTLAPFMLVAPAYLWLIGRPRQVVSYLALLAGVGSALSAILILLFGPLSNMWFHMVTLVSANPWQQGQTTATGVAPMAMALLHGLGELFKDCAEPLAILAAAGVAARIAAGRRWSEGGLRHWAAENPWVILLIAALALSPAAVLGASIVGGFANHIALCNYFLTLSAALALMMLVLRTTSEKLRVTVMCSITGLVALHAVRFVFAPGVLKTIVQTAADFSNNDQELIYNFDKTASQQVYFPWHPLPALLAEGKLYHFEWGAIDRYLAGRPVGFQQLSEHLPQGVQYMAFKADAQSRFSLQYFPRATREVHVSELPGFSLFTEPAHAPPAAPTAQGQTASRS